MSNHASTYDTKQTTRELARHYIPATAGDIAAMLKTIGLPDLASLYREIPESVRFATAPALPDELDYASLCASLDAIAARNKSVVSFLGDGLPVYRQPEVLSQILQIRNLTTAYTPYQPERSQGTLISHWIYQCLMSQLLGFEAVNSSLYDRATALHEAACCALRLTRDTDTVIISEGLYPGDIAVLRTLTADTAMRIVMLPLDPATGLLDPDALSALLDQEGSRVAAVAFSHINTLGLLESVDTLTDLAADRGIKSIAVIDPMLIATGGLKPPSAFGKNGADIAVGEGHHLTLAPNFGGPGLGIFAVRLNETTRNDVRATPGRYVGKAADIRGRDCHVMVLSTREQHIRKDKATSNICSNQAFLATLAGAALLARGDDGMATACRAGYDLAREAARLLLALPGVELAYPAAAFFNELVIALPRPVEEVIQASLRSSLLPGVDVSDRIGGQRRHLLKLSFSDCQSAVDVDRLVSCLASALGDTPRPQAPAVELPTPPADQWRKTPANLLHVDEATLLGYYQTLGKLNVSPDDGCYPLGSCTMKYNPLVNDWAAGLPGFTQAHPQAPVELVQGSLQVLFEIQEWFKAITGLAGVTTQPVAGAQGELVGVKLFQAYHRDRGEGHRDVIFIPKSAHGTNFATAVMAGFASRRVEGREAGIVLLESDADGRIDLADFQAKLERHGKWLSGVMITNPNTCGLFENEFKIIADAVHKAGGLVYMDGANMNAIAGWINLGAMGVDAVHNNLHKTWTIPHGGGGPGDAIVAVSERLLPYLPGYQIVQADDGQYRPVKPERSIGSFHRHWGNFAHKVRCLTYLKRLGRDGVPRMTAMAVLAARYLLTQLAPVYPVLPKGTDRVPRMHEFILTLSETHFQRMEAVGIPRNQAIARVGKLFLDFGFHAPTVAWPEAFGLMIEPTESYTREELDRFAEAVATISQVILDMPEVLKTTPHFTPVDRVDEVTANRNLVLSEPLRRLPPINPNRLDPSEINRMPIEAIVARLREQLEPAQT